MGKDEQEKRLREVGNRNKGIQAIWVGLKKVYQRK